MRRRLRRELFCILSIIFSGIVPALGGMLLAGYLSTKGWPDGFCVPFGIVSLAAGIVAGLLIGMFVTESPIVKEWIEEPKKEKPPKRQPKYGAWQDEPYEDSHTRRD